MGRCLRCHRVPAVAAATPMAARAGSASAAGIRRTPESASVAGALLHLQRQYGNQYVGRALRQAGAGEHDGSRLGAIRREIEQTRGGSVGRPMDLHLVETPGGMAQRQADNVQGGRGSNIERRYRVTTLIVTSVQ